MYTCERDKKVESQRKTEEEVGGFGTCLLPGEQLTDGKECSQENRTCKMRVKANDTYQATLGTFRDPALMVMPRNSGWNWSRVSP